MKTLEKIYKKEGYPEMDKFDKKAPKFDYYDMLEFAARVSRIKILEAAEKLDRKAYLTGISNDWNIGYKAGTREAAEFIEYFANNPEKFR